MEAKRRPGRPSNPEPREATARVDIRMPPDLRRWVRMEAAAEDLSMGQWVRRLIETERRKRPQRRAPAGGQEEA